MSIQYVSSTSKELDEIITEALENLSMGESRQLKLELALSISSLLNIDQSIISKLNGFAKGVLSIADRLTLQNELDKLSSRCEDTINRCKACDNSPTRYYYAYAQAYAARALVLVIVDNIRMQEFVDLVICASTYLCVAKVDFKRATNSSYTTITNQIAGYLDKCLDTCHRKGA